MIKGLLFQAEQALQQKSLTSSTLRSWRLAFRSHDLREASRRVALDNLRSGQVVAHSLCCLRVIHLVDRYHPIDMAVPMVAGLKDIQAGMLEELWQLRVDLWKPVRSGSASGVVKRSHWNDFVEGCCQEQVAIDHGANALTRLPQRKNLDQPRMREGNSMPTKNDHDNRKVRSLTDEEIEWLKKDAKEAGDAMKALIKQRKDKNRDCEEPQTPEE